MRGKTLFLVATSALFAVVCVLLGFWQIRRLHEKQQYNANLAARRFLQAVPFDSVPRDTGQSKFRRVKLAGSYDYSHEILWTLRGRDGSPGVNILTPLRRPGTDTAVLVNRGWVYSPDATNVNVDRWREPVLMVGEGYVLPLQQAPSRDTAKIRRRSFRSLDYAAIRKVLPYPVAPIFAVLTSPGADSANTPPRVIVIPLDEGSHRSYAFQWFSFAAISIIGAVIFTRKT